MINKIKGSLFAAAVGNAMGAPTADRTISTIKEKFNGEVKSFVEHPDDNCAYGAKAGTVTDFSLSYVLGNQIVHNEGLIEEKGIIDALLKWYENPDYRRYIGSTSEHAFYALRGEKAPFSADDYVECRNERATNGAAARSGLAGLLNPGNIDQAIDDAIIMSLPTHGNDYAISGATAVAAAVAEAMKENTSYVEVVNAGIYGAREGMSRTKGKVCRNMGAKVDRCIAEAVEIGLRNSDNPDKAMVEIADIIGTSQFVYESVAAVFGILVACKGNTMDCIRMAVNIGDDTDTVACIVGYICGSLNGIESIDEDLCHIVERVNEMDLSLLADDIYSVLERKQA